MEDATTDRRAFATESLERGPTDQAGHNRRVAVQIVVALHHLDEIRIVVFMVEEGDGAEAVCSASSR